MPYEIWLSNVKRLLWHQDAIKCVVDPKAFELFHRARLSHKSVADRLNMRWVSGYLDRLEELKETK